MLKRALLKVHGKLMMKGHKGRGAPWGGGQDQGTRGNGGYFKFYKLQY